MSRGAGSIEKRIADLFAATRHHALTIDEIAAAAFALNGAKPSRAQRLSATRAAQRLLRRHRLANDRLRKLRDDDDYAAKLEADPAYLAAKKLWLFVERIGIWERYLRDPPYRETDYWQTTTIRKRLFFHPPDVPVQVWAVTIDPSGVHWFDCEIIKVTRDNVMVRYQGVTARLNRRRLWHHRAWWRGVMFVSSRTGRIAARLDAIWWQRWQQHSASSGAGMPPLSMMRMSLAEAMALLGVPPNFTKADVLAAFRRKAKEAHPDFGGTAEIFRRLVEARDRLLASIGTSAPPPKPPQYHPSGSHIIYQSGKQARKPLSSPARLLR